jgi:hypothetical protein
MSLMYLHLRPAQRQDQPFDDMDDDTILMEFDAQHSLGANVEPDLHDLIMETYNRLGLA